MKSFFTLILLFFSASILFSQVSSNNYLTPRYSSANIILPGIVNSDSLDTDIPDEKSPWVAFFLSYLIPTTGQFYNGELLKGFLFLGGITIGLGAMALGAGTGDFETSNDAEGIVYTGLAIGGICYIWQLIDAPVSASRINEERRMKLKRAGIEIFPEVTQRGFGASVRISF